MKIRCPCCGASMSLDVLLANDDARAAMKQLMALGGETASLAVRYVGLFRPAKSELSFARLAVLLGELIPDMQAQRISRNGQVFEAPAHVWQSAMRVMLDKRDRGELELPLKSHGYLYEVMSKAKTSQAVVVSKDERQMVSKNGASAVFAGRRK